MMSLNVLMSATLNVHAASLESKNDLAPQKQCSFLPCSMMEESNRYMREGGANSGNASAPGEEKAPQITLGKATTIRDYPIPCDPSPAAIEEYGRSGRCDLSYSEPLGSSAEREIGVKEAIERCQRPRMLIGAEAKKIYIEGDTLEECKKLYASNMPRTSRKSHRRRSR
jgi:hypothetical protein